jgi:hypothetical protein
MCPSSLRSSSSCGARPCSYRSSLPAGQRLPLALFSATALPLVVVIADIGVQTHLMRPQNATALESAAILSVMI